jgi:hypothetical protein
MTATIIGASFAVLLIVMTSWFILWLLDDDEPQTSPARGAAKATLGSGPGNPFPTAALQAALDRSGPGRHVPDSVRDRLAQDAWTVLGARKAAEYGARLDAVESAEQDTVVIGRVAS